MSWLVQAQNVTVTDHQGTKQVLNGEYAIVFLETSPVPYSTIYGPIDRTPITDPIKIALMKRQPIQAAPIPAVAGLFKTHDLKMAAAAGQLQVIRSDL